MHVVVLQVLLDNCETLKLSDFTLAQSVKDSDKKLKYDFRKAAQTAFGERSSSCKTEVQRGVSSGGGEVDSVPSPFYAAPELFNGGHFSAASDLWSLGVLMYELCTGE